jgi:predicted regulator of Ras-like GTPase activity (Roadblock/LC7/MglB family)
VSGEQAEIDRIVDEFVGSTAHVRGAVLGSADGHPLAARLDDIDAEASTVAAMGAAALGLATQLARVATEATTTSTSVRAAGVQVWVFDIGNAATLTVFGAEHGDAAAIVQASQRAAGRLITALTTLA